MSDARLRRRARLVSKADYRNVFAQAEQSRDAYFTVLARANDLGFPRLGLAISKKAAKSAVVRNRIKRVIRESFRHHQHDLGGIDIVVIGRTNLTGQDNRTFFKSLDRHWIKLATLATRCAKPRF